MRFTKMQGAGNDYVYVNQFVETLPTDLPQLARRMSDRHFGVGADGLILIGPSDIADAKMTMFNADGSEAQMCGNGIRCCAKYIYEHDICRQPTLSLETGAGVLSLDLMIEHEQVPQVRVDMGEPILDGAKIPTKWTDSPVLNRPLAVDGRTLEVTCVSMGNPHCVTFVHELNDDLVLRIGPKIEFHEMFPERVNVEFVQAVSANEVVQRTWERGSGETLACGTGASAVCVAGVLTGRTERALRIRLLGGELKLEWSEADNHVFMTGPAEEVFAGEWPL
jgi:diaminopimelate epimerase